MFWISVFSGRPKKSKRKKTSDKQQIVHDDDAALLEPESNAFIFTERILNFPIISEFS